jgi:hypothetical protein
MLLRVLTLGSLMALFSGAGTAEPLRMGPPLGVSWSPTYGFPPGKAETFAPQARALGAGFTRIGLYWSQLEPKPGEWRWTELDAYLDQIADPEEAILTLSSASPWATRSANWVFPSSPAKDAADYAAFVRAVVQHSKGRIHYFQSDPEPNNPFFWQGSAEDFAAQQRVFYGAVKAADPKAVVVLGGCDGLFDPTGEHPVPGQQADMAFFSTVIAQAAGAFDVFDLRLYGDAYGIAARVRFVRDAMAKAGGVKPIIATEYDGPGFFEFPINRRWAAGLMNTAAETVGRITASADSQPIETRMFLPGSPAADREHLWALAADDLVIRNVLALASGVQRTAYFDLWHDNSQAPPANVLQFGSFQLLEREGGVLGRRLPLGEAFARLAGLLNDARDLERVPDPAHPDLFVFKVTRRRQPPLWIAWRRAPKPGEILEPEAIDAPWLPRGARAANLAGAEQPLAAGTLAVGSSPVFIRAR